MFNSLTFYIILSLSASTLGFGYLSYSLSNDKAIAVHALKESQETVAGYEKSLNLAYLSCKIDDAIATEYQAEKQVQQDKTQATISKIDNLPKRTPIQVTTNDEIDIDSKLPVDLVRMLSESCIPDEGDACVPSR